MMCQYCNQNEATRRFVVNIMGQHREVHLCDECAKKLNSQAGHPLAALQNTQSPVNGLPGLVFSAINTVKKTDETDKFPEDAGSEMRSRRYINQLRSKLNEAIKSENYEEAAKLRDTIKNKEKGTYAHD